MIGNNLRRLVTLLSFIGVMGCSLGSDNGRVQQQKLTVVPYPNKILKRSGSIELTGSFWVIANVTDPASADLAGYLVSHLKSITRQDVLITDLFSTRKHDQSILLEISQGNNDPEAYTLDITSTHIKINSGSAKGVYYGMQTLLSILKDSRTSNNKFVVQKMVIKDYPQLDVRGVMFSPTQVAENDMVAYLSIMSMLKLNTLYLSGTSEQQQDLVTLAQKYFIDVKIFSKTDKNISLVNYSTDNNNLEKFYTSYKIVSDSKGLVLDLTSSNLQMLQNKLIVLADISWANSNNKDYKRVSTKFKK